MDKIKIITDTASDIPDKDLQEYHIDMLPIPIAVDGQGYFERKSFSISEFYKVLSSAKEIPTTSRVPINDFLACYKKAYAEGHNHIIVVTINSGGSATDESARMAIEMFFKQTPEAQGKLKIHVVDSGTYSAAYGHPVTQAAKMARSGVPADEILAYLDDFFSRVEILLGCYSLEYAKRSGRISAMAGFVGDMLGLRPIITLVAGKTKVIEKVRGDKNLALKLFAAYEANSVSPSDLVFVIRGEPDEPAQQLAGMVQQKTNTAPPVYYAGASIIINAGPRIVALVYLGKKRPNQVVLLTNNL